MHLATFTTRLVLALFSASLSYGSPCSAQELSRAIGLTVENDYFVFWVPPRQRTDDNYTQGARLNVDAGRAPVFGRRLLCSERRQCGATIEIGQEIYTPTFDAEEPIPGERPYAGWLYARGAVRGGDKRAIRSLRLTVGVTGPASLAEPVQTALHKSVQGFRTPLGWEHQLPTEVAFAIQGEHAWRVAPREAGARIDLIPSVDIMLGTLRTAIGGGTQLRVGTGLTHPWLASPTLPPFGLSAFVGARAAAVTRDLFLDGSTFRRSARVDREPVVLGWERGVAVSIRRFGVEYRAVTRGREYRTGPKTHTFGSLSMLWKIR